MKKQITTPFVCLDDQLGDLPMERLTHAFF